MVVPGTKMSKAAEAVADFINKHFIDGYDRCMVATFNDGCRLVQELRSEKAQVLSTLGQLESQVGGGTLLYDSLAYMTKAFWDLADPRRPWVKLTVTDGADNRSKLFPHGERQSPAKVGQFVLENFTRYRGKFACLVGCGRDGEIDKDALVTIGQYGRFPAMTVDGVSDLGKVFQDIACRVLAEVSDTTDGKNYIRTVRPRIVRLPIDMGLLIDCSGSMGNLESKAHLN